VWLYRIWPKVLHAMVLIKPATVVDWYPAASAGNIVAFPQVGGLHHHYERRAT
jgi:hypothetical protein